MYAVLRLPIASFASPNQASAYRYSRAEGPLLQTLGNISSGISKSGVATQLQGGSGGIDWDAVGDAFKRGTGQASQPKRPKTEDEEFYGFGDFFQVGIHFLLNPLKWLHVLFNSLCISSLMLRTISGSGEKCYHWAGDGSECIQGGPFDLPSLFLPVSRHSFCIQT